MNKFPRDKVVYINCGTKDDAIKKLVEMMDALVGVEDKRVQYVRFERRPLINGAGADLVIRNGVTLTEGGDDEIGIGYEIKFDIYHEKGETK